MASIPQDEADSANSAESTFDSNLPNNHAVVFLERPEIAAEVFRKMFLLDDSDILRFMTEFLLSSPTQEQTQSMWASGFPLALLEAVSNQKWYETFKVISQDDWDNDAHTREVISAARRFACAIDCLGQFATVDLKTRPRTNTLEQMCAQFPNLFKLLWEYRSSVFSDRFALVTHGSRMDVAQLRDSFFFLFSELYLTAPAIGTYIGHVSFYLWFNHESVKPSSEWSGAMDVFVINRMLQSETATDALGPSGHAGVNEFFREVIPAVIGSMDGAKVIRRGLVRGEPIKFELYRDSRVVILHMTSFMQSGDVNISYRNREFGRVHLAIATVARQYECHGCIGQAYEISEDPWSVAVGLLNMLCSLCNLISVMREEHLPMSRAVETMIVANPYKFSFVGLVAEAIVISCDDIIHHHHGTILMCLGAYARISRLGSAYSRPARDPLVSRKYHYLRRVLQAHWLPILERLRTATSVQGELWQKHGSGGPIPSLNVIKKKWERLGRDFDLSSRAREDDTCLIDYVTPEERRLGCFSTECPNYGEKPLHRTRRTCTGCWAAFYCGKRCQKKDWKAGHKTSCSSRDQNSNMTRTGRS